MQRYLIIGNGVAGTTAAEAIRKEDASGQITMVTDEDLPFYYRIRLNEYLCGDITEQGLIAKQPSWYGERQIILRTGVTVTDALPEQGLVVTATGEQLAYDRLLLATGGSAFVPPLAGGNKEGVFTLRNVGDARRIMGFAKQVARVVLIGGGLLGLETGNALRKLGKEVMVVEFFPRLLPRQLDGPGAARLQGLLETRGFAFRLGATTKEITGVAGVTGVTLANGETLPADMVVLSAGVRPNLELAGKLGLLRDKGIKVDGAMRTSRPEVYAAGDVAEFEGRLYGIWPAAMAQGRAAGKSMAGGPVSYHGTTMTNSLKVVGIDLASAGEIDADQKFTSQVRETATVYRKYVVDGDRLIGCIMLGDTTGFAAMTSAIKDQTPVAELSLQ
jgi:nitrite reductase (NADH) large subunit